MFATRSDDFTPSCRIPLLDWYPHQRCYILYVNGYASEWRFLAGPLRSGTPLIPGFTLLLMVQDVKKSPQPVNALRTYVICGCRVHKQMGFQRFLRCPNPDRFGAQSSGGGSDRGNSVARISSHSSTSLNSPSAGHNMPGCCISSDSYLQVFGR